MGEFTLTQIAPNDEKAYFYPNADLSGCTEWDTSAGVDHWSLIDEQKDSVNFDDYVSMQSESALYDVYALPDSSHEGTITYVKVWGYVRSNYVPESGTVLYFLCSPESVCTDVYLSSSIPFTESWSKYSYVWINNPKTSSSWTWSDIDSLSIGLKAQGSAPNTGTTQSLTLRPNGVGTYSQFDTSGDTPNWKCVDDSSSDGNSTYVYTENTSHQIDTYNIEYDTALNGKVITNVSIYAVMKVDPRAHDCPATIKLYLNGSLTGDDFFWVDDDWVYYSKSWAVNPWTSSNWTDGDIQNMEIGFKGRAYIDGQDRLRCTKCYATVEYKETGTIPTIYAAQCYAEVGYTPPIRTYTLSKPHTWSQDHAQNVKTINFWNGTREVYALSRSHKTVVLEGSEYSPDNSFTPCDRINDIRTAGKNGSEITIQDIGMDCLNRTYRIISFGWKLTSMHPQVYDWVLELEDANL